MRSIAVFCGSSSGRDPAYVRAAEALGEALAQRQITLVYGGGNVGLMGALADAVLAHRGKAIGVIPDFMMAKELGHAGLAELKIVPSMHERKAAMEHLADAFIALPGGFGTLEESCEILTWGQLGLHAKPFGLLNVAGFYDHLLAFLDHAVGESLLQARHRALVLEAAEPADLLEKIRRWRPPAPAPKWLDRPSET